MRKSIFGTEEQLAAQLLDEMMIGSPVKASPGVEMPQGSEIEIRILSTWGDPHYVGLTGIEVYDSYGEKVLFPNPR